jgi:hypothetical protein
LTICEYENAVKISASTPIAYAVTTMPPDAENTAPKIAIGAIGTMKINPYASRSRNRSARRSSC